MNIVDHIKIIVVLVLTFGIMPQAISATAPAAPAPTPAPTAQAPAAAQTPAAPAQPATPAAQAPASAADQLLQDAKDDLKESAQKLASEITKLDQEVYNMGTQRKKHLRIK